MLSSQQSKRIGRTRLGRQVSLPDYRRLFRTTRRGSKFHTRLSGRQAMAQGAPVCRKCGIVMQCVAEIAATSTHPGLKAFMCHTCGSADSVLVYLPRGQQRERNENRLNNDI